MSATCIVCNLDHNSGSGLGDQAEPVLTLVDFFASPGNFQSDIATATLRIVSGTDQLRKVTGAGKFKADPSGSIQLDLQGI